MIMGVNSDTAPLPDFILKINLYKFLLPEPSANYCLGTASMV